MGKIPSTIYANFKKLLIMKKNYFIKKQKRGFIALIIAFLGLFVNTVVAQDTFTWNGSASNDWATAANWTKTGSAGTDTYPGQTSGRLLDLVVIDNGGTPNVASGSYGMLRLTISNATGPITGSTLTIASGATLSVTGPGNTTAEVVFLKGGNIVNNGTLNATGTLTTGTGGNAAYGITCGTPAVLPSSPTEFGYSGSGTLNINTSAGNNFSGGIILNGIDAAAANVANATYKLLFNGTANFVLSPIKTTAAVPTSAVAAIRVSGSATSFAFPVIIGGNGFTLGSAIAGVPYGLINQGGAGTKVTINPETTLTAYSGNGTGTGNGSHIMAFYGYGNATVDGTSYFTNKGIINMYGTTTRSGISISTEWDAITTFENQGAINIDLNSNGSNQGAFLVPISGTAKSPNASLINFINKGTISLNSPLNGAAAGFAIIITNDSKTPSVAINNSGTLNLTGANFNWGGRVLSPTTFVGTSLLNSGTIISNQELRSFSTTNTSTGTITFTNTGQAAPLKLATFTVGTAVAATVGATYTDANSNVHTVVLTKVAGTGTSLSTTVAFGAIVPGLAPLTKTSGTGDASIAISALTILNKNALNSYTSNSGTINTTTGPSYLNIISGVSTDAATSIISPGGDSGKGIAVNAVTLDPALLQGTIKLQVSGNTAAGVDYDQYNATGQVGGFDISGATLDVTGIYTPVAAVTIDIMTTNADAGLEGALIGEFASVVGLTPGWSVVYTSGLAGKVQLAFDPNLATAKFSNFKFSVYPNPTSGQLNVSADKNISKVELFNLLGQKVQSNAVNAAQKQFDISNLQNGIYLMQVTIDNAKEAFKVIKQ